jgi:3-oxoacyl-[acyl-carrier protein] reductase
MSAAIDLSEKVILITGSSRGIGRECALWMARAGARVAINHRNSPDQAAEVAKKIGPRQSIVIQADVADHVQAAILVAKTVDHFGRLDVLVNNAAIFALNPFDGADYHQWQEGWRRTLQTNIVGPANLVFLALPQMRRQGGGKVINISSRAAWRGETEFPDYGASKAALVNLTRSIARACAKYNITSTCVAPGFIDTEMAAAELARRHDEIVAQVPLGRVGSVEDVAGLVLFLASPMADYLNGATVDVNGGSWFH